MPTERWKPNVTVAAIVAQEGRYLLVQETSSAGVVLNNPAGHLEAGESPLQAVVREALEETGRVFTPHGIVGLYLSRVRRPETGEDVTYLRIAFAGTVGDPVAGRALDHGIVGTLWLTADDIRARAAEHRTPLLQRCIDDHLAGRLYPLDLLHVDASVEE